MFFFIFIIFLYKKKHDNRIRHIQTLWQTTALNENRLIFHLVIPEKPITHLLTYRLSNSYFLSRFKRIKFCFKQIRTSFKTR